MLKLLPVTARSSSSSRSDKAFSHTAEPEDRTYSSLLNHTAHQKYGASCSTEAVHL